MVCRVMSKMLGKLGYVDTENETLVLVEGDALGMPDNLKRLQDFQFELQFIDGIGSVYSPFALRDPPQSNGNAPLLLRDPAVSVIVVAS